MKKRALHMGVIKLLLFPAILLADEFSWEDLKVIREALAPYHELPQISLRYKVKTEYPKDPYRQGSTMEAEERFSGAKFFHWEKLTTDDTKSLETITSYDGETAYELNFRGRSLALGKRISVFPTHIFNYSPLTMPFCFLNPLNDMEKPINDWQMLNDPSVLELAMARCEIADVERDDHGRIRKCRATFAYDNGKHFTVDFVTQERRLVPEKWQSTGYKNAIQQVVVTEHLPIRLEDGQTIPIPGNLSHTVTRDGKLLMTRKVAVHPGSVSVAPIGSAAFVPSAAYVEDIYDADLDVHLK